MAYLKKLARLYKMSGGGKASGDITQLSNYKRPSTLFVGGSTWL
jgi:hypothetical protein